MNKVFGIDLDTWVALNAIGAIFSAFGTLAAVIVALHLARRAYPLLNVSSAIMKTHEQVPVELITITGTNVGHTPINIEGIFWTFGWFRRKTFILFPNSNSFSKQLPKEISHSQQVFLAAPLSEFTAGLEPFVHYLKGRWYGRFLIRSFRCGLYTSNGAFSSRADFRIRDLISKAYEANPKQKVV